MPLHSESLDLITDNNHTRDIFYFILVTHGAELQSSLELRIALLAVQEIAFLFPNLLCTVMDYCLV